MARTARTDQYTIWTTDGYVGRFDSKLEAEHERRIRFGTRALAHPIVRVARTIKPRTS